MAEARRTINVWGGRVPIALSAAAIGLLILALTTGWGRGPPGDEGAAAHLWQLLLGLQIPLILAFVATADWRRPLGPVGMLGLQVLALMIATAPVAILRL